MHMLTHAYNTIGKIIRKEMKQLSSHTKRLNSTAFLGSLHSVGCCLLLSFCRQQIYCQDWQHTQDISLACRWLMLALLVRQVFHVSLLCLEKGGQHWLWFTTKENDSFLCKGLSLSPCYPDCYFLCIHLWLLGHLGELRFSCLRPFEGNL